jgi:hypothetical protein
MSVHVDKPPPNPATILSTLDVQARETMKVAQADVATVVSSETPHSSGETARALAPRLSRTSTGVALLVGPPRGKRHGNVTVAQVVRWVTHGTGELREGPGPKRRIRAKNPLRRLKVGRGVARYSVKGQRPDHFMARIEQRGTPRVEAAAERGAQNAARALERVV